MKIQKFISEKQHELFDVLLNTKNKTLLVAPMKSGKTTFVMKDLYEILRELEIQLVFITPKVSLMDNLKAKYPNAQLCKENYGASITEDYKPILSTPDSLYKVIAACKEQGRKFYIVYDEVHEAYQSYNFRKKLARPFKDYDEQLCAGFLGMTATPDNIKFLSYWDNVINIDPTFKFIQSENLNIIYGLDDTVESICSHIQHIRIENNNTPIICRINDKDKIRDIANILGSIGIKCNSWTREIVDEEGSDNSDLFYKSLEGLNIEFDVLLTTSLIDVGVEIMLDTKPILVDFMGKNSLVIEDIQFIGRFREGLKSIDFIVPSKKTNKIEIKENDSVEERATKIQEMREAAEDAKFKSYQELYDERFKVIKNMTALFNELYWSEKATVPEVKATYNSDEEIWEYEIDEFGLNSVVFRNYIQQFLNSPFNLKKYLDNHETLNISNIETEYINKSDYTVNFVELVDQLKAEKSNKREEFKNALSDFKEKVINLKAKELEILLTKQEDISKNDLWIYRSIEELHQFYHTNEMKEFRKRVYTIKDLTNSNLSDSLLMVLKDEDITIIAEHNFKTAMEYYNQYHEKTNKVIDERMEDYKYIYGIRESIKELKGCEVNFKLSNKFKEELLTKVKRKRYLSRISPKTLEKYLSKIYNIDKNNKITSVKKH